MAAYIVDREQDSGGVEQKALTCLQRTGLSIERPGCVDGAQENDSPSLESSRLPLHLACFGQV